MTQKDALELALTVLDQHAKCGDDDAAEAGSKIAEMILAIARRRAMRASWRRIRKHPERMFRPIEMDQG